MCFLSTAIAYSAYGKSPDGVPRFQRLTVLHVDVSRSGVQWQVSDALPFLLLPSLTDLTLGGWGVAAPSSPSSSEELPNNYDSTFAGESWIWPVRSSPITRLSLIRPFVSGTVISKMIHACKALSEFEIVHPNYVQLDRLPDPRQEELVYAALLEHVYTLMNLSIGYLHYRSHREIRRRGLCVGPQMHGLKSLQIPLLVLTGVGDVKTIEDSSVLTVALPGSIEHLWIDLSESLSPDIEACFTCLQRREILKSEEHLSSIGINL